MTPIPDIAISVRQPWAWAIIHAGKDCENRTPYSIRFMRPLTGRRAIHAAKGMTRDEYESARDFMETMGIACPPPADLQRGGIIGSVDVIGSTTQSHSRWFMGPAALQLRNPEPCVFVPAVGQLGYFPWSAADPSIVPQAAQWMLPKLEQARGCRSAPAAAGVDLFNRADS